LAASHTACDRERVADEVAAGRIAAMEAWELVGQRAGGVGYVRVVARSYRLPDGRVVDWDVLDDSDSVAVLATTSGGEVVLVRQFRTGPGLVLDELPGGVVEEGEDPAETARRELVEETGFVAGEVEIVGSTWMAGHSTRRRWVALATGCRRQGPPKPDGDEFCEAVVMPLPAFREHLRSGQLTNADVAYLGLDHAGLI
jgi:ADP-ribose pyrophosphatase